ncbi:TIGR03086 family metal-binding protein [Actinophytocola sp.]|uniref:TIGR03086 family metal-binding protein n=1 Tax=Actinophytocola sp. TaxID=1872138 RepID=UPI003D6A5B1F
MSAEHSAEHNAEHIAGAAARFTEIVHNVKPGQLADPTPCTEFDVRGLVNHLLFWGPSLVGAARKELVPPPAASESDVDLTGGDWAAALEEHAGRTAAAWGAPAAWEGVTRMGGPMQLPAELIGGMVAGELVVHGWDLARATGQRPDWDSDLLRYVHGEVERSAELGRSSGVYGPEVTVPADSSTLDRLLALSGRDPRWTP